jgi:hypothetical protein
VVGVGVDTTARIEPETEPNKVFCSTLFHQHLHHSDGHKVKGKSVGVRALAKGYGQMELFQIVWQHERLPSSVEKSERKPLVNSSAPMPRIGNQISEKQLADALHKAFKTIKKYFERALKTLESQHPRIETALRVNGASEFICEIYLDGKMKNTCKIWVGNSLGFGSVSIGYSEGKMNVNSANSYNEIVNVRAGSDSIYFEFTLISSNSYMYPPQYRGKMELTPEQVAEALWMRFIRPLE